MGAIDVEKEIGFRDDDESSDGFRAVDDIVGMPTYDDTKSKKENPVSIHGSCSEKCLALSRVIDSDETSAASDCQKGCIKRAMYKSRNEVPPRDSVNMTTPMTLKPNAKVELEPKMRVVFAKLNVEGASTFEIKQNASEASVNDKPALVVERLEAPLTSDVVFKQDRNAAPGKDTKGIAFGAEITQDDIKDAKFDMDLSVGTSTSDADGIEVASFEGSCDESVPVQGDVKCGSDACPDIDLKFKCDSSSRRLGRKLSTSGGRIVLSASAGGGSTGDSSSSSGILIIAALSGVGVVAVIAAVVVGVAIVAVIVVRKTKASFGGPS